MNKKKQKNFIAGGVDGANAPREQKFLVPLFSKSGCFLFLALFLLTGCATPSPPAAEVPHGTIALAICQRGWHTEIGVPDSALTGPLASLGPAALHRHYLLIGYGARAYFTNPQAGAGDAAIALFPGPAAINLAAFDNLADGSGRQIVWLDVSQADINRMLAFVWASMPRQGAVPAPIVTVNNASMFYAARPDYNILYNCNNWAVDALRAAGLPFSNAGLHFSSDVIAQAKRLAAAQEGQRQFQPGTIRSGGTVLQAAMPAP